MSTSLLHVLYRITSHLKNISDKLAKWTKAILVEYIKSEQYLNVSQKNTRIDGTVWFSTCVVKKWSATKKIDTLVLSWYGVVNSNKTHLGDVTLILLYLLDVPPKFFTCMWEDSARLLVGSGLQPNWGAEVWTEKAGKSRNRSIVSGGNVCV